MIKTAQFIKPCVCRSVGECWHNTFAELTALDKMVDSFAEEVKSKLRSKCLMGYTGWDNPELQPLLLQKLKEHIEREGQEIDVGALAAMLWNMKEEK